MFIANFNQIKSRKTVLTAKSNDDHLSVVKYAQMPATKN
jgi:hypothetical protein